MSVLLAALLLSQSQPVTFNPIGNPFEPTFNLSAVRVVSCKEGYGSGFMTGKNTVVTALHVASMTNCHDAETGVPLVKYKEDPEHDFAMMTGTLPEMSYFRYDCGRYVRGHLYTAFGYSGILQPRVIFRSVSNIANGTYADLDFEDGGHLKHIAVLIGYNIGGMSGGPIGDPDTGFIEGMVNAGEDGPERVPVGQSYSYELADTPLCKR